MNAIIVFGKAVIRMKVVLYDACNATIVFGTVVTRMKGALYDACIFPAVPTALPAVPTALKALSATNHASGKIEGRGRCGHLQRPSVR